MNQQESAASGLPFACTSSRRHFVLPKAAAPQSGLYVIVLHKQPCIFRQNGMHSNQQVFKQIDINKFTKYYMSSSCTNSHTYSEKMEYFQIDRKVFKRIVINKLTKYCMSLYCTNNEFKSTKSDQTNCYQQIHEILYVIVLHKQSYTFIQNGMYSNRQKSAQTNYYR